MNGWGSHRPANANALRITHAMTTIDCPMMYCDVPKKRAMRFDAAERVGAERPAMFLHRHRSRSVGRSTDGSGSAKNRARSVPCGRAPQSERHRRLYMMRSIVHGRCVARTRDLLLVRQALSQLS
jgi:hypothetical protein